MPRNNGRGQESAWLFNGLAVIRIAHIAAQKHPTDSKKDIPRRFEFALKGKSKGFIGSGIGFEMDCGCFQANFPYLEKNTFIQQIVEFHPECSEHRDHDNCLAVEQGVSAP